MFRDCLITGQWDTLLVSSDEIGTAAHDIQLYDCRIVVTGPSSGSSGESRGISCFDGGVVKVYGGSIDVTDNMPTGTRFIIELPA